MIDPQARPRLAAKARLRHDRISDGWLLLYPERGLQLNRTGVEIVRLCTGEHTVAAIVDLLTARYDGAGRPAIEGEVAVFLECLAGRGLVALT